MREFAISILFLIVSPLITACFPPEEEAGQPAAETLSEVLISPDDQDIDSGAPALSDSELLNQADFSQLELEFFAELYETTFSDQESLLKGSVDLSSNTINYFDIDDFDTLSMKTSGAVGLLKIVDYGPSGVLPIEMRKPTIYVQFNQPMVPISKLGEPLRKSSIMTITPEVPGTYRWYGTKILSFKPDAPTHRNRTYSVRISKNTTSIHGKKLETDYEYVFLSEFLEMLSLMFGPWKNLHDAQTEVPPEKAKRVLVTFNQTVDPETISEHIRIIGRGKSIP